MRIKIKVKLIIEGQREYCKEKESELSEILLKGLNNLSHRFSLKAPINRRA